MKKSLLFLAGVLLLASCTIQQRVHQPGWYFQWNHSQNQSTSQSVDSKRIVNESTESDELQRIQPSEINNQTAAVELKNQNLSQNNSTQVVSAVSVKSTSFSNSIVSSFDSPKIENKTAGQIAIIKSTLATKIASNFPVAAGNGKSWIVALLLCFFLGALGIHRFYLGYTGMGILYLLTLGLFGIGVLVDFILILVGALQPKGGRYSDH